MKIRTTAMGVVLAAFSLALFAAPAVQAQTHPVPSRVTAEVDESRTVSLKGNVHPMARPEFDRGAVADSQPMTRMLLTLQRSAEQETALQQLMDAQQTKGSASYHAWLTPEQFGKQFGPSDADVQAVTDWLTRQGFQVAKVAAGRTSIEFNGTVAQVRNAFHTEIHKFSVNGDERIANVSEPAIPAALAPVVRGVAALNTFPRKAHLHNKGVYRWQRDTGEIRPLFTFGNPPFTTSNPANFAMAPADFAKIYNIPAGATGAGQTIAVIGQSNINAQDVIDFRNLFGLPANFTQANNIIVNGPDPGLVFGDETESDLDVEWAGAVAPNATILLVTSSTTQTNPTQITAGIDLSALYAVDNNLASVISESYGSCEPSLGSAGNLFYNALWEQAAAQGITVVVSSGDSGSAGCDPDPSGVSPNAAVDGTAVSGIASTPFNVAVGGTDFDPTAQPVTPPNQYWSATNGPTFASALMYIPETTWDDSLCAFNYPAACNNVDPNAGDLSAAGGGPSNCAIFSGSNCSKGYPIPAYQAGFHTSLYPTVRTIPDVSLFASNGGNGVALIICEADDPNNQNGASCSLSSPFTDFSLVGGTSASTPPFGAIVALLNQASGGKRQGNVNFGLYFLAKNDTNYTSNACNSSLPATPNSLCIFNDVTKGNIGVACVKGSTSNVDGNTAWCQGAGATFGVTVANNSVAYGAGPQYDLATGLGSVNVTNLLAKWSTFVRTGTTTTVTNPTGGTPSGSNFSATVTVTPAGVTGDVSLNALASDQTTILASFGPYTLSGGTKSVTTNLLPPGTAFVSATYEGDSTHGMSTSSPVAMPVTVAGANFTSATTVGFVTFNANNVPSTPSTSSQSVPYGSPYALNISVTKSGSSSTCGFVYSGTTTPALPCPKGTIALKDGANPLNDFPAGPAFNVSNTSKVSNQGFVEDGLIQLAGGTHSIVATFTTGDTNYQSSTSNTLSVTITPAPTTTLVASSLGVITSGSSVTLTAVVGSSSNSTQGPTGTVQFQNGATNLGSPATCTPASANANVGASCTAILTTTISALFPPPVTGPRPTLPLLPSLFALLSIVLFALGWRWMPEKRRRTYAYAGFVAFALLAVTIAGCGGGGGGGGHTITIKASYVGDTNYAASSGSTNITVQ
ncbi:MAG TPA: protease pro-enzyme activation domain-containing protein [Candidatus Acidoferrum sp.]|nr:protease pro-enzyme activation domain-containing protein [Candidatus Acidoferrum sp.]